MSDMKWNGNNTSEGLLGRSLYSIIPIHSNHSNLIKVVNSGHGWNQVAAGLTNCRSPCHLQFLHLRIRQFTYTCNNDKS